MIVPSPRAVVLLAAGAPLAVLLGAWTPGLWLAGAVFALAGLLLVLADALAAPGLAEARLEAPAVAEVGQGTELVVRARWQGRAPVMARVAIACDPRLAPGGRAEAALLRAGEGDADAGAAHDEGAARLVLVPARRGPGVIDAMWLRWDGPLGLGRRQRRMQLDREMPVIPDVSPARSPAIAVLIRDAVYGQVSRRRRGEGSEFEALAEYRAGMDRRAIDWKASARHTALLAREHETERNTPIVFALDCGSAMCEPVAGVARLDRAITAALTTAYVALKAGDRVSLFSFAARVEAATPFVSDPRSFFRLQKAAAQIDYRAQEPNFTLALSTLATRLQRRSLVVLFTDFTDPTSAELMIESLGRLVERHLLLFVILDDAELRAMAEAPPDNADRLAEAVAADTLMEQKRLVLLRLARMGIEVIEAPHDRIGTRLIDSYLRIKQRGTVG